MTTLPTPATTSSTAPTSSVVASSEPGGSGSASKSAVGGGEQISAQEAKDRKEIEALWLEYWDVLVLQMQDIPPEDRQSKFSEVVTEPSLKIMVDSAKYNDDKHWASYGKPTHNISWTVPINGDSVAIIDDCQNQSNYGVMDTRTKKKITKGPQAAFVNGTFERTADGWRLADYIWLKETPCTP